MPKIEQFEFIQSLQSMQNSQNKACRLNSTQIFFHNWKLNHRSVKFKACDLVRCGHPGNSKGPARITSAWPNPSQRAHMCAGQRPIPCHPSRHMCAQKSGTHAPAEWGGPESVRAHACLPGWHGMSQSDTCTRQDGMGRAEATLASPLTRTATLTSLSGVCVCMRGGGIQQQGLCS